MAASEPRDPRAHVRAVVARSGSSFLWGMRVLPRARREAMYAIYAFCREVDDIADDPTAETADQLRRLDQWRAEIDRVYDGTPGFVVARALQQPVRAFDLPRGEFHALLDGMEMDVRRTMCAPAWAELERYCRCVAGAVGMLSIRVFGSDEPRAPQIAVTLGEALQLTNILRDLAEDAALGRLYLPKPLLEAHGIEGGDPQAALRHPALVRVCAELGGVARARFGRVRGLLANCDRRHVRPCILMMEVYERLLERMARRGWRLDGARPRVSGIEKLWLVLRHGIV